MASSDSKQGKRLGSGGSPWGPWELPGPLLTVPSTSMGPWERCWGLRPSCSVPMLRSQHWSLELWPLNNGSSRNIRCQHTHLVSPPTAVPQPPEGPALAPEHMRGSAPTASWHLQPAQGSLPHGPLEREGERLGRKAGDCGDPLS